MSSSTLDGVTGPGAESARRDAWMLLLGLLLLAAWDLGGLDVALARAWGTTSGFPWRDHWLTAGVMHGGIRILGWLAFSALLINAWRPFAFSRGLTRRERLWWLGTVLACAALIPLLKRASATSCPWALAEFGGAAAHYVPHWVLGVRDGGPGGCFPSGHASTAFAFIPGWFALRARAPRAARLWLLATIGVGVALGAVQMVRGAHYASHSMWTAWVCWAVSLVSYHLLARWRAVTDDRYLRVPGAIHAGDDAAALAASRIESNPLR